jgi:hypothetical protein
VALETHVKQMQKLIAQIKGDQGSREGKAQKGSGKADQPIPRKRKGEGDGNDSAQKKVDNREPLKGDHLCTKCEKWSPFVKFTHDTKDCERWDANGKFVGRENKRKAQRANHFAKVQKERAELSECFAQMRKEHKALMKKMKSIKRNPRRRIAMRPPLRVIVTPPEGVGPKISAAVMKL